MLTSEQIKTVSEKVSKMQTAGEVFRYLDETFDLDSCKVTGTIVGPKFKDGIVKALQALQPKLKK